MYFLKTLCPISSTPKALVTSRSQRANSAWAAGGLTSFKKCATYLGKEKKKKKKEGSKRESKPERAVNKKGAMKPYAAAECVCARETKVGLEAAVGDVRVRGESRSLALSYLMTKPGLMDAASS